jgi:hypothetical protein
VIGFRDLGLTVEDLKFLEQKNKFYIDDNKVINSTIDSSSMLKVINKKVSKLTDDR